MSDADITICDVGPRDGLQNESLTLSPRVRAELIERLVRAGVRRVEVGSFVHPARVPQMAGVEDLIDLLPPQRDVTYAGLVLNERGYERARATAIDEIHYAVPVTDSFCRRNQGTTLADAMNLAAQLAVRASSDGLRFTVTLAVAFGCPFEGRVEMEHVLSLARRLTGIGVEEIVFADTIGVAVPSEVKPLVGRALDGGARIGVHLHNTRNTGYANVVAALEAGATAVDASVGGTGGCPFAPRATGNVATEDVVYLLERMGYTTGIELDRITSCAEWLGGQLGAELPGLVGKAGPFPSADDGATGRGPNEHALTLPPKR